MKKAVLLFAIALFSGVLFAQQNPNPSRISVSGTGEVIVKPDMGVIMIGINAKAMDFSGAIKSLDAKSSDLKKQISGLGIPEKDIKTTNFWVDVNRVYNPHTGVATDSGYVATQQLEIEFKNDPQTISKILTAFSKSKTDYTLGINFRLSDSLKEKVKNEVLKDAVGDAKAKATILAGAAGITLKKIHDIRYGEVNNVIVPEYKMAMAYDSNAGNGAMSGFTPKEQTFTDTVTIIWEIE